MEKSTRSTGFDLDKSKLPMHVAIIMDGNGRWALQQGKARITGHQSAIEAVRDTIEGAAEIGIPYLTLYAFSTENWQRPAEEVRALMELLVATIRKEKDTLLKNNIKLHAIGNLEDLSEHCRKELQEVRETTAHGTRMTLSLALSYGSRSDIVKAARTLAKEAKEGKIDPEKIDAELFSSRLSTAGIPDPELLIRTSGEYRISNFLLWEIAYAELYISSKLWPDFRRSDLYEAVLDYQKRERRFGKTSEQL